MRYSVARQSDIEQQEMLVPGWTRLRNHGASAGSAFGGGSAPAAPASNIAAAKTNRLIAHPADGANAIGDLRPRAAGGGGARLERRCGDAQKTFLRAFARTRPIKCRSLSILPYHRPRSA